MVERISGYTAGVVGLVKGNESRAVSGEARNARPVPRHERRQDGAEEEPDGNGGGQQAFQGRQRGYGRSGYESGDSGVLIGRSTAMLLTQDLSQTIQRSVGNVAYVVRSLLSMTPALTEEMQRKFHIAALAAVRKAREAYLRSGSGEREPTGLCFDGIHVRHDQLRGSAEIRVAGGRFVDRFELRADGVVFDVRGDEAVHEPKPGIFVDTGEHGAATANTIIETVRRDLPDFGGGADTFGATVLIRADRCNFSGRHGVAGAVEFDLLVPCLPTGMKA